MEMKLSTALQEEPDKKDVDIFKKFNAKVRRIRKQLNESYWHLDILRDRLVYSEEAPHIEKKLRDGNPKNPQ